MATDYVRSFQTVRMEGLEGVLKTLQELPHEVVSKRGGPVRSALNEAAKVLIREAQANIDRIIETPNKDGRPTKSLGILRASLITVRDPKMSKGERYTVRIRRKTYYPEHRGRAVSAYRVGMLLERGTERREPMPWLQPAYDAKKNEVLKIFEQQLRYKVTRIVRRLARKNGVRL